MTALNFPNAPTAGDLFENYVYDGTKAVWRINPQTPGFTLESLSDTTIDTPVDGQALVYDTATSSWINETPATTLTGLTDTNITSPSSGDSLVYDGTDWVNQVPATPDAITRSDLPAGSVLQVVSVTKTDFFSSTAPGWVDVTGLTATITPVSASSEILVMVDVFLGASSFISENLYWKMLRGSTDIGVGTNGSVNNISGGGNFNSGASVPFMGGTSKTHKDSPATTSATTYKVQLNKIVEGGTMYINRRGNTTSQCGISTITLMEVAG